VGCATDYAQRDERLRRDPQAHADSYRRIRNTARFLLGNLARLRSGAHAVPMDAAAGARSLGAGSRGASCSSEIVAAYRTTSST
jgi:hypothetical protein